MEKILKEILESIKVRQKGAGTWTHNGIIYYYQCNRGKGSKAYIIRRIDVLLDELKELKEDIKKGKYDCKGGK